MKKIERSHNISEVEVLKRKNFKAALKLKLTFSIDDFTLFHALKTFLQILLALLEVSEKNMDCPR